MAYPGTSNDMYQLQMFSWRNKKNIIWIPPLIFIYEYVMRETHYKGLCCTSVSHTIENFLGICGQERSYLPGHPYSLTRAFSAYRIIGIFVKYRHIETFIWVCALLVDLRHYCSHIFLSLVLLSPDILCPCK